MNVDRRRVTVNVTHCAIRSHAVGTLENVLETVSHSPVHLHPWRIAWETKVSVRGGPGRQAMATLRALVHFVAYSLARHCHPLPACGCHLTYSSEITQGPRSPPLFAAFLLLTPLPSGNKANRQAAPTTLTRAPTRPPRSTVVPPFRTALAHCTALGCACSATISEMASELACATRWHSPRRTTSVHPAAPCRRSPTGCATAPVLQSSVDLTAATACTVRWRWRRKGGAAATCRPRRMVDCH
mmetsp:Transcript_12071/g.38329  ORF Transcript_12071/g.38329 Transcript_12071/m.38329 type:complete len:242 (-) Transcript_12071:2840-3565(-)